MKLSDELKVSIREIFERPEYYGRSLSDNEVQELADNLASYGELLVDYAKGKSKTEIVI